MKLKFFLTLLLTASFLLPETHAQIIDSFPWRSILTNPKVDAGFKATVSGLRDKMALTDYRSPEYVNDQLIQLTVKFEKGILEGKAKESFDKKRVSQALKMYPGDNPKAVSQRLKFYRRE